MRARFAFLGAAILAVALAACGGGGGGGGSSIPSTPTPSPTSSSGTATFGGTPTTQPLPAGAGVSGTVSLPAGSGTASVTASSTAPTSVGIQLKHREAASAGNVALAYVTLTAQTAVTINGIPGVSVTLPSGSPQGTYFIAYYGDSSVSPRPQAAAWVSSTTTGATGSAGATITIPATTTPTITLAAGQSAYFALYVGGYIPPININGCVGVQSSALRRPNATGVHPIGNGDTYDYTGTMTSTIYRTQPCPQPTATANANVTLNVSVSGGVETSAETDAFSTNSTSLTTQAQVTTAPSGVYEETAETSTDGNGDTIATTYSTPLQFAKLPDAQGNTWNGVLPSSVNQTLADGTTIDRTYAPSSTIFYKETQTLPTGYGQNVITTNNDGSGSYEIGKGTPNDAVVNISAPGSTIKITIGSQSLPIPSWFPAGFTSGNLYSDVTTDKGTVASLPTGCTSPVASPTAIEHLQRVISSIDPVLGTLETETIDSYDENAVVASQSNGWFGPVCVSLTDTLAQYYDWSATSSYGLYFSLDAKPVMTNTLTETITLGTGFVALARGRDASQAMAFQIAARQSGIHFTRALQHAQIARDAEKALHAYLGGGL